MATKKRLLSPTGLDGNSLTLTNVATPSASSDASTKGYVDTLVPSQTGNTGKYLTTNGSATSWGTIAGGGSVTSITAGTGLSGGVITTSGTIAIDSTVATLTGSQTLTNKTLTSPTFTAPVLGTPASGTLTNCTFPTLNQNTTGSAGSVTGLTINNSSSVINPNSVTQNQIGYANSVSLFGETDGGLYSSAYNSTWIHEIFGDFRTGQIAIRGKNSGTFTAWRTVLDSTNYTSYSPTLTGTGASGTWGISITGSAGSVPASGLTGSTLASGVTASSLTSVGTLGSLTVSGRISVGDSVAQIYQDGSRLKVRSESTDDVVHFASYGMYLPKVSQTYNLYLAEGLQIGYGTASPYLSYRTGDLIFRSDATERMRLTAGGSLGIGTSPTYKTDIYGTFAQRNAPADVLRIQAETSTVNGSGGVDAGFGPSLLFYGSITGGGLRNNGRINAVNEGGNVSGMAFWTQSTADIILERMRISAGGSVGIGTTSPSQKLSVSNNIILGTAVSGSGTPAYIDTGINYSNGATRDKCKIYLYNSGTEQYGFSVGSSADVQYHSNGTHDFYIANSLALRINSSGNVGIGATPSAWYNTFKALQIAGNGSALFGRSENNDCGLVSNGYVNTAGAWTYTASGYAGLYEILNGQHYWATAPSSTGAISFTNRMTLDNSGVLTVSSHIYASNGYMFAIHFNQSSSNSENPTIAGIWANNSGDNYCRKSTPAHFKSQMGMYHNNGSSTSNIITISSSTATGGSDGDIWLKY